MRKPSLVSRIASSRARAICDKGPWYSSTQLDAALSRITSAQAAEGATYQQVQNTQAVQSATGTSLATQLSDLQDIDLADMAVRVSTANVTYQAALQTYAMVQRMSLFDYIK